MTGRAQGGDQVVEIDLKPHSGQAKRREPAHRRTGSPVRRDSQAAGGQRAVPVTWSQRRLRLDAFDRLARDRRKAGQRWGAAGTFSRTDREILAKLLEMAAKYAGEVFPTLRQVAAWVGCSVRSVVGGLKRLKAAGFLSWDRRYVDTDRQGLRGPQVEQTSNFYYMALPTAAAALINQWRGRRTPREDEAAEAEREGKARFLAGCRRAELEEQWKGRGGASPAILKAEAKAAKELAARQAVSDSS